MDSSKQAASQLWDSPSGSSLLKPSSPYLSGIDNSVKTDDLKKGSSGSSSCSESSSSEDGGFVSGEEEFETARGRRPVADTGEETLEIEGGKIGGVLGGSSEFPKPETEMPPVAVATSDDGVEGDGVVTGNQVGVVGDGVVEAVESVPIAAEGFVGKPEIVAEPVSSGKSNSSHLVEEGGLGVIQPVLVENKISNYLVGGGGLGVILPVSVENKIPNDFVEGGGLGVIQDGTIEVSAGSKADGVVETSQLDEEMNSGVEGSMVTEEVVENGKRAEEGNKYKALNTEDSVMVAEANGSAEAVHESLLPSHDNGQNNYESSGPADKELVEAQQGVKFTTEGDSVAGAIQVNMSEPEVAVDGEMELSKDSRAEGPQSPEKGYVELANRADQTSHAVENTGNVDSDKNLEISFNRGIEVEKSEPSGIIENGQQADSEPEQFETTVKFAAGGDEHGSSKELDGDDGQHPVHDAKHIESDVASASPTDNGLEGKFAEESLLLGSDEPSLNQNSSAILEAEDEDEDEVNNHIDEEGEIGDSVSDGETDGMIFGSSEAAKQFIEELERGSDIGSFSAAKSSQDQPQGIDGQIVSDSDEEADTDEEGDGKELFDSAALAALLKAATGAGSDSGNITITSQDGSRLFSIERPAGLGSSARSFKPATRPNRSNLFSPSGLTTGGESENNLSEEEKKKLDNIQQIRVKFLRLVQRLGVSSDESVAAQVLYRLALVAGRQTSQTFNLDAAKRTATELEAEGKDDLNFSVNILVLGKSGVGKSATINSIFGENKALIDAFEPATTSVKEITGMVNGVKIKVFDTPGLRPAVMEQAFNRRLLLSIKKLTKKSPPDIVLYVDRLDSQTRDLNDLPLLKTITSTLGPSIWRSAIVTLTHAASAPPDGPSGSPLSYEVFVTQRSHVVQQSIGHAVGDLRMMSPSLMNPVSLVENHPLCRKNREGQKVLPNGQTWKPQLLLLCYSMKILSETSSLSKPQDPFDHRKLFGFRVRSPPLPYMLSSMLQTRAHPKLSSDQGVDNGDSDIDLTDLSDSDQEEEEDEYDQLPPFKPLRKSQIAKLSKEQKKAYFEEYDYRVKLLQKKQWREELKRLRELKKRGKDAANEYGFIGEDAEQENGGAAPVSTPLPDMVLPPSFDSDNPAFRYRFLEPTSQFLARPVLDTHGWDHDCGYDGVNLEQSLAIASRFPAAVTLQITKDKKDFSIHLDSSVAAKHGENGSSMAGFDIQTIGKQLAYIVRGETKFKNLKKNKTAAGISITFLGENVATGVKVEDQIAWGKQWALVGSAGTIHCQGDAAYGANFELQRREIDYPVGQVQSTYGLSLIKWRGDWALGFNTLAQFSIGRSSKVAVRAGINNKLSGQVTVRSSSSEHLAIALAGIIPIISSIYRKISPAAGDNYSIY
ncbi:translocase of chloroplast 159, chloroplastic [Diospyros lotus]|uniref:translocase of chloroplast 159, chloroplastic n=1 Tax=Diospyros lotus TaxID=55363 RepID=UPI0022503F7C|nr:translocase of chloroplast 159, chloroplastic [Diospyros lotus]